MMAAEELDAVYRRIAAGNEKQHEMLFSLQGMFLSVMEFDPVTDDPLPITIDDVLHSLATFDAEKKRWPNDRLQHIVSFASSAVRNLIEILHEKNLREHRISRPEKVHEVDSRCMMWLAKKPGFTVKQKIASGQRMMGVYHTTSLDTAENRLFKAFMRKLDDVLIAKEDCCRKLGFAIPDEAEHFTSAVHRWLKSDEAEMIGSWGNTPPNNTLLNDKNYRKIWKAHLMLQKLDEQVQYDMNHLEELKNRAFFWLTVARLNLSDSVRFMQDVLFPDYTTLSLLDKNDYIAGYARDKNGSGWERFRVSCGNNSLALSFGEKKAEYSLPNDAETLEDILSCARQACQDFFPKLKFTLPFSADDESEEKHTALPVAAVDLSSVLPSYTLSDGEHGNFSKKLVHQACLIERSKKKTWYPCTSAQSKLIRSSSMESRTFSIHSVFDSRLLEVSDSDDNKPLMEKACSDFARIIKEEIHCQKCLYVVSDDADDFSPAVNSFKHSMNSSFSKTEILPRSIATLFTKLPEILKQFSKNDELTVRAVYDDYEVRTKIRLDFNEELARRNPETKGITFQRLIFRRAEIKAADTKKLIPQDMDRILTTQDASLLKGLFSVDAFHFEAKPSVPPVSPLDNEIVIRAGDDMSSGAVEYERLQGITPDIALWNDFLPKLSMEDSTGKEYVLVEPEKVHVPPVVGKPVQIPISWKFSFPAGKEFYEFPLAQGEKKNKAKYFAFIKDASFPLEHEIECRLYLTYTYGMPLPYSLEFIAISGSAEFKSVAVSWENKEHPKDLLHISGPEYVTERSWEEIMTMKFKGKLETEKLKETSRVLEYLARTGWGKYEITGYPGSRTKTVDDATVFFLNRKDENGKNCVCFRSSFPKNYPIRIGTTIRCSFVPSMNQDGSPRYDKDGNRGLQAYGVCVEDFEEKTNFFFYTLPLVYMWEQGRSTSDTDFPKVLYADIKSISDNGVSLLNCDSVPKTVKDEVCCMLASLHKDAPKELYSYLYSIMGNTLAEDKKAEESLFHHKRLINAFGYAVGNAELSWQKELLDKEVSLLAAQDGETQNLGIEILGIALWRTRSCIEHITASHVKTVLPVVVKKIREFLSFCEKKLYPAMSDIQKFSNSNSDTRTIWFQRRLFLRSIELLLALYRIRTVASVNAGTLELIAPIAKNDNLNALKKMFPDMEQFCTKDKAFTNLYAKEKNGKHIYKKLVSRIQFHIDDESRDKTIPDYLYALEKYTKGEDCRIRILKIDNNDDEEL